MSSENPATHFGVHLTIDGYGGDFDKLNEREVVYKFLNELPEELHMQKMHDPVLVAALGNDKKDSGGWTGVVTIAESHISIHTFPARHFVSADVYTCQNDLDQGYIIQYITELFGLKEVEQHYIIRGTQYPVCDLSESKEPSGVTPNDLLYPDPNKKE